VKALKKKGKVISKVSSHHSFICQKEDDSSAACGVTKIK
jgi:hypothetical protein